VAFDLCNKLAMEFFAFPTSYLKCSVCVGGAILRVSCLSS
jgi:hypothetical protein